MSPVFWALILALVSYLLFTYISIPIHELGHLVCGKLSGYRFVSFRVFSFTWVAENGRVVFRKAKNKVAVGQCLMAPPENEADFRFVLYNLGGGLFNLIVGAACLAGLWATRTNFIVGPILVGATVVSLYLGLVNLIPLVVGIPNDGMNLLKALQSPEAKHGMYLMLRVNDEQVAGKCMDAYPDGIFDLPAGADLNNYLTAYVRMCESSRLHSSGEHAAAAALNESLLEYKLPRYYLNALRLDLVEHYSIYAPDYPRAKELFAQKGVQKQAAMGLPTLTRIWAAYTFFAEGNQPGGRALLEKAKMQLHGYPNLGLQRMETKRIAELEEKMNAAETAVEIPPVAE